MANDEASRRAYYAHDIYLWEVVDALTETFQKVTGKRASAKVSEALYDAIRFEA